jgi:hypothetical protein
VEDLRIQMLRAAARGDTASSTRLLHRLQTLRTATWHLDEIPRPIASAEARGRAIRAAKEARDALKPAAVEVQALPEGVRGKALFEDRLRLAMSAMSALRSMPAEAPAEDRRRLGISARDALVLLQESAQSYAQTAQRQQEPLLAESVLESLHSAYQLYRQSMRSSGAEATLGRERTMQGLYGASQAREAAGRIKREGTVSITIEGTEHRLKRGHAMPAHSSMPESFRNILAQGLSEAAAYEAQKVGHEANWSFLMEVNALASAELPEDEWEEGYKKIVNDFRMHLPREQGIPMNFSGTARTAFARTVTAEPFDRREAQRLLDSAVREVGTAVGRGFETAEAAGRFRKPGQ